MSAATFEPQMLEILRHALGLRSDGSGAIYRNHFVTGAGSADHKACMRLVAIGYMRHRAARASPLTGGDDLFLVTDEGKCAARPAEQPARRLSRAQRRYRRFLDADSGLSFGQWLRRGGAA